MNSVSFSSLKSPPREPTSAADVVSVRDALVAPTNPLALKVDGLLRDLPSLTTLITATSKEERALLTAKLGEIAETLSSLTTQVDPNEDHAVRALEHADILANDRITRGFEILRSKEIPEAVGPLSGKEQVELALAMEEKRNAFWRKLYEVPFVQREAIATLESLETKQGKISTIIFPPRTQEYRSANKSTRDAILLASTRDSLDQIQKLGDNTNAGIGSDYRKEVAAILARTPLAPEHALVLASECKRRAQSLIDAEIQSSGRNAPVAHQASLADFGASALQVRGFIAELVRVEEPYIRLKNYMVMSVTNLAHSVVNRTRFTNSKEKTDLFQSSVVGIMRGVERFDPGYGTRLTTNVFERITQGVRAERSVGAFAVSIPLQKQQAFFKVRGLYKHDESSTGLVEIAAQHGISIEDARAFVALLSPAHSLDFSPNSGKNDGHRSLHQLIPDKNTPENDQAAHIEELKEGLSKAFLNLNRTERRILSLAYGLGGGSPKSDAEIGVEIGMRTERVKNFRNRSLIRLKRAPDAQRISGLY